MNSDYGGPGHHFYHHHLSFPWLPEVFPWLPSLAGLLVTVAVVWLLVILLVDVLSAQSQRALQPATTRATMRHRWYGAVRAHAATAQQFAAYECTPTAVAEHPDLADVTRPATALFINAFTEANELATEHYPGAQHAVETYRFRRHCNYPASGNSLSNSWYQLCSASHGARLPIPLCGLLRL